MKYVRVTDCFIDKSPCSLTKSLFLIPLTLVELLIHYKKIINVLKI